MGSSRGEWDSEDMGQTVSDRTETIERCKMNADKEEYVSAKEIEKRRKWRDELYWEEIVEKYVSQDVVECS